jgi:DNA polymerase elongation subunit (family B)
LDVASYYPNLAIKNKFYPKHLSDKFCDIYEQVYNKRAKAKKKFKTSGDKVAGVVNDGLKLALNGTYGKSNDRFSFFYDPSYTMSISKMWSTIKTVNCWNLLKMLILQHNHEIKISVNVKKLTYD